jgi:class 3 adenylate cyclase
VGQVRDSSLVDAAREAIARDAWTDAHDLLTQADREGDLDPGDLGMLARAAYLTGHPEEAITVWERAHGIQVRNGNQAGAAETAVRVSELLLDAGQFSAYQGWVRRAEGLLRSLPESPTHGQFAVAESFSAFIHGDLDTALASARQAIVVGTRVDDPASRILGRNVEGRILIFQGQKEEGLALLDETIVAAVSGELDPFSAGIVYCSAVCGTQAMAEYERAEEWTDSMERFCARHATGSFHGWCRVHRAEIKRLRGLWREAEAEARQGLEEVSHYVRMERGWPLYEIGLIRLRLGDLAGAEEALLEAHELGWDPQPGLALVRLAQGRVEAAAVSIREALDEPSQVSSWERPPNSDFRLAPLLEAQVEIASAAGDLDRARWAADELDRLAGILGTKAFRAMAAIARGRVLLMEGDGTTARRSLATGVQQWRELGAPYETARARVGLAAAYRMEGMEERALMELKAAGSTFGRLGAKLDARLAAESAAEMGRSAPASERSEKVFVFTDIVKSTNLVELIGDEAWGHLVRWHNTTLASLVSKHGGEVVRTTGDGFFVTFDDPRQALECAVAIQRALDDHRREQGFSPVVRIGMHRAAATREGKDWSGAGVHAAARVGSLAEGDEILVTRDTAEQSGGAFAFSEPRTVQVKGITEPLDVVSVEWR